jgi:hypothetical protein
MLTDVELDRLAAQVDQQLQRLREPLESPMRGIEPTVAGVPDAPVQRELIERETGQPFETFWQRYRRHLRKDLCVPGGMLHEQWRKYRDIESKSAVRVSYAWLAAMGIPTASVAPVAVAATVFLLNVALKVGIDTVCEGASDGGSEGQ